MHWTSHMDQYDVMSHPHYESPLPYLISSQPQKDPLPLLRPAQRASPSLLHTVATSSGPSNPLHERRAMPKNLWNGNPLAYGRDPNWRTEQISFLHSEQKRHASGHDFLAKSIKHPWPRAMPAEGPHQPTYEPNTPMEVNSMATTSKRTLSARPAEPNLTRNTPEIPTHNKAEIEPTIDLNMEAVKERIPSALQRYFTPSGTHVQPHLDILRERKRELQRKLEQGDPTAVAEVHEARAAKRRTNANGLLSDKEKKANHIASEQKRRANIRKGYDMLCDALPGLRARQPDGEEEEAEESEGKSNGYSELAVLEEATDVLEQRLHEHRRLLMRKADLQSQVLNSYSGSRQNGRK